MAEIMIKAAGFVFVIIIACILKQVHVLEKRDGLTNCNNYYECDITLCFTYKCKWHNN